MNQAAIRVRRLVGRSRRSPRTRPRSGDHASGRTASSRRFSVVSVVSAPAAVVTVTVAVAFAVLVIIGRLAAGGRRLGHWNRRGAWRPSLWLRSDAVALVVAGRGNGRRRRWRRRLL